MFIELVSEGVLEELINPFRVFVPLRRTGMKLTQLKRKTYITATGMRKHKAWRPSLQVTAGTHLASGWGLGAGGWGLGNPLAQKPRMSRVWPSVACGARGVDSMDCRGLLETLPSSHVWLTSFKLLSGGAK